MVGGDPAADKGVGGEEYRHNYSYQEDQRGSDGITRFLWRAVEGRVNFLCCYRKLSRATD